MCPHTASCVEGETGRRIWMGRYVVYACMYVERERERDGKEMNGSLRCIGMYVCIYIQGEREGERERDGQADMNGSLRCICMYVCIRMCVYV